MVEAHAPQQPAQHTWRSLPLCLQPEEASRPSHLFGIHHWQRRGVPPIAADGDLHPGLDHEVAVPVGVAEPADDVEGLAIDGVVEGDGAEPSAPAARGREEKEPRAQTTREADAIEQWRDLEEKPQEPAWPRVRVGDRGGGGPGGRSPTPDFPGRSSSAPPAGGSKHARPVDTSWAQSTSAVQTAVAGLQPQTQRLLPGRMALDDLAGFVREWRSPVSRRLEAIQRCRVMWMMERVLPLGTRSTGSWWRANRRDLAAGNRSRWDGVLRL